MWRHSHPDWVPAAVLLVATICMVLDRGMIDGTIPTFPSWSFRYASARTLTYYLFVPGVTLALLGYNPVAYLGLGRWRAVIRLFALGVVVMLVLAGGLLTLPSAGSYYAEGPNAESMANIFIIMLCTEFFCRGFLLLPLFERFRWNAAFIALVPYSLLHIGKPPAETLGSIPYALALSYLAIRSGSVLYGVILHWILAYGVTLWVHLLR